MEKGALLQVAGLTTAFPTRRGLVRVVDDVSFTLAQNETLAIVGESGSGKSVLCLSVMGLIEAPGRVVAGAVRYGGRDLLAEPERHLRALRGADLGMVFQEPKSSLNPVITVGEQICEALYRKHRLRGAAATKRAAELLDQVRIPAPLQRLKQYPHELSGGMCQRVMIAIAIAGDPKILIADEPTTALDVTTQAQTIDLLSELQRALGMAILFVTHDLAVVAEIADRVAVMYAGRIVETAPVGMLFRQPRMPYTAGLLAAVPDPHAPERQRLQAIPGVVADPAALPSGCAFHPRCAFAEAACRAAVPTLAPLTKDHLVRCVRAETGQISHPPTVADTASAPALLRGAASAPLIEVRGLETGFPVRRGVFGGTKTWTKAVDGVDLTIYRGETLGLVGESGSGKTTLGRSILRLATPRTGTIRYDGVDLVSLRGEALKPFRSKMQIVFQDPATSLNPRMTVAAAIREALQIHGHTSSDEAIVALLEQTGLSAAHLNRTPGAFSGGQRQRIGIARALAVRPEFLVADEPVAALDVSVQAQIVNLLDDLRQALGLTMLFISHDLGVVRTLSDRIAVMYRGRIVEVGTVEQVFNAPRHPYTAKLLASVPARDPERSRRAARGSRAAAEGAATQ